MMDEAHAVLRSWEKASVEYTSMEHLEVCANEARVPAESVDGRILSLLAR